MNTYLTFSSLLGLQNVSTKELGINIYTELRVRSSYPSLRTCMYNKCVYSVYIATRTKDRCVTLLISCDDGKKAR